ncbi:MAG TPA: hypothetical protein VJ207_08105 [Thermoplasmata archaeon]|nr:hypothetical protein [Thermoplasmata archaeon]
MAVCPRCSGDLPEGLGSVCPTCGHVIRIPGIVKLALTLLALGFAIALVWAIGADALFASLWGILNGIIVQPLGLQPPPFELTGTLKQMYDFIFGTTTELPWGGILLILAGLVVGGIGGAVVLRAESRRVQSA